MLHFYYNFVLYILEEKTTFSWSSILVFIHLRRIQAWPPIYITVLLMYIFFLNKILIHIEGLKFYLYFLDVKYCGLLSKVSL